MEHEKFQLKEKDIAPTADILQAVLSSDSYAAYEQLQETLPSLGMEQVWQWYTPHKAWFARGQYFWTSPRGKNKEKTLYWLYVFEGYFTVAVWFKEKNRAELLSAGLSEQTKQRIQNAEDMGSAITFPVLVDVKSLEPLAEIVALINCKKMLES